VRVLEERTHTVDISTNTPSNDESIDELQRRLASLVEERQRLRRQGAPPFVLERNRRAIIAGQSALSVALGARYGARAA